MNRKGLAILVLAAIILYLLATPRRSSYAPPPTSISGYNLNNQPYVSPSQDAYYSSLNPARFMSGAGKAAPANSASLIPREVVQTEDFGQFSPDKILSGQNYLDPRSQVGYPETLGGNLRNANRDFRSEPLNPRTPVSIFNLSTIPPDVMRPKFEIANEYQ
jgi:hypothetical protein